MSVHTTRLIRLLLQTRQKRKQVRYPKFPSREWLLAQRRLLEMSLTIRDGAKLRKLLGPHLGGQWTNNLEILRKWQPPFVLMLQPEVDKVTQLRDACPDTIIVGRFFHDDSHYASNIDARPKEFAHEIHQEIVSNPVTPLLDYAQSNNEVCQDWAGIQKLNEFTQEWMALADQSQAYKCAILAFSVGNPDLPHKPGDPAGFDGRMLYWQQVLPSLNYAQRNDHILLLHGYGYPDMFHPNADWYIYRYERQVQANLKTLGITNLKYAYGEIGIDRLIVNGKGGYKVVTNDQDYTNQLLQCEKDLQGQDLLLGGAIFTFGDSGGWDTYDIASTNVASLIAAHYVDHAGDYKTLPTGSKQVTETHIPTVSTGTTTQPTLPPRQWDERLTARGVSVETPPLKPGQQYWRVVKAQWWNEQEAQGRHHIYVEAPDGTPFVAMWPTGNAPGKANGRGGFDAGNFPMSKSLNEFNVRIDDGKPSETLKGIGMGDKGNSAVHTSTGATFQLVTWPAVPLPTQPTPVPEPTEQPVPTQDNYVIEIIGARIRTRPVDGDVLTAVPYGDRVDVVGIDPSTRWRHVRWNGVDGWMSPNLISDKPPLPAPSEPTPQPEQPSGDKWQRSLAFVLAHEGGWADDPNDPGGATMKGITIGTFTRWRKAQGRPDPTKDELRAISDAEVNAIYKTWYWDASDANTLPFPMCLAVFDLAVNGGIGRAREAFAAVGHNNFLAYMSWRLHWYTRIDGWKHFSAGWARRVADLLEEASKT